LGLDWATGLARSSGAKLWIVHVDQPLARGEGQLHAGVAGPEGGKRARLRAVVPGEPSIEYDHKLLIGDPADEVVRFALRERADLIVLGTHGRRGLRRIFAGSVAADVVRRAPCPVLVFPQS
jgi:universal stress protein A